MAREIDVNVGKRSYRMVVEEGQESRVKNMAARFDHFVKQLQDSTGGTVDRDRLLVLAGIMMADEHYSHEGEWETSRQSMEAFHSTLADRLAKLMQTSE